MKKVLIFLILVVFLAGCTNFQEENPSTKKESGVWISFYELGKMLESDKGFKSEFTSVIKNCKKLEIQNLYIHTRAFGDSLYESDYFPLRQEAKRYDFDIFGYIVDECKKSDIKVYAWINPYRISTKTESVEEIDVKSPAYKWLKDESSENDINVAFSNGIYLNPASSEVRELVLDSIRELIAKYEIDGVHFDDYFYPTTSDDFDKKSYEEYKKGTEISLSLEDWRRENVNILIEACYNTLKYADEKLIFSVSPAANVKYNFENLYADVSLWIKRGWLDEIIPQLYFGFEYPDKDFRFDKLLKEWKTLSDTNSQVALKIGLASYKSVPELEADKVEWESNDDIIARQVEACENEDAISGYVYFSYSSLFGKEKAYKSQRENILETLKTGEKNE